MNKTLKTVLIVGGALLIVGAALFAAAVLIGGSPKNILESEKGSYITGGVSVNVTGDGVNVTLPGGDVNVGASDGDGGSVSTVGAYDFGSKYSAAGEYSCEELISGLNIDWVAGSVRIEAGDVDTVCFSETAAGAIAEQDALAWGMKDGALYIQYCDGGVHSRMPVKDLTVTLPLQTAEYLNELKLDTVSADMSVSGITCNEMSFDSTSGAITAQDCTVSRCEAGTTSGDISVNGEIAILEAGTTSGAVRAQTSKSGASADVESVSGEVELIGFRQNDAGTTSGAVTIETPEATEIDVETVSGEVTLRLSEKAEFTLDYETVSGDLSCDFATVQKNGKYICGGGGTTIEVGSTSGGLTVKYA